MAAQIKLTWTDVNISEAGFRVYRSDNPIDTNNLPAVLADLSADTQEYVDDTVVHGNRYYYVISSYDSSGNEEFGEEIDVLCDEVVYAGAGKRRASRINGFYSKVKPDLQSAMQFVNFRRDNIVSSTYSGQPRSIDVCPVTKNIAMATGIIIYQSRDQQILIFDQEGQLLYEEVISNGAYTGVMCHFSSSGDLYAAFSSENYGGGTFIKLSLNTDQNGYTKEYQIDNADRLHGGYRIGISPDGTTGYICSQRDNELAKVDLSNGSVTDYLRKEIYDNNSNLLASFYNVNSAAVDGNGYVYVATGQVNEKGENNIGNSSLVKLKSDLTIVWSVDDTISKANSRVTIDGYSGSVYVLKGEFETTEGESLVEKYDTDGNLLWSSQKFPIGTASDIAIGLSGDVYVSTAKVGSRYASKSALYRLNPSDGTIVKQNNGGGVQTGENAYEMITAVAVDPGRQVMAMGAREA